MMIDSINPDAHRVLVPTNDPGKTVRHGGADHQLRPGNPRRVLREHYGAAEAGRA